MRWVQWWFLLGVAVCLAGAVSARELAHQAHDAGRHLRAGAWTIVLYLDCLALLCNAGLAWFCGSDTDDKGEDER